MEKLEKRKANLSRISSERVEQLKEQIKKQLQENKITFPIKVVLVKDVLEFKSLEELQRFLKRHKNLILVTY